MSNKTIDEILGIETKDVGSEVLKLIDINKAKQDIEAYYLKEVLDMIGEDEIGNIGYDGEEMVDDTTDEMFANNTLKHKLRKATKERFK